MNDGQVTVSSGTQETGDRNFDLKMLKLLTGFNDKNLVVCVRQLKPLTKFEKMWNSPCIAIEDPFDLEHNLGAGLSRKSKLSKRQ